MTKLIHCVDNISVRFYQVEPNKMTDCNICTEIMNASTRNPVTCASCEFICCKQCFIRFVTNPDNLFQCMSCRIVFDRTYLHKHLSSSFMKTTYRDCRTMIVYDREKLYFPETQELVVEYKLKKQISDLKRVMRDSKENLDELTVQLELATAKLQKCKQTTTHVSKPVKKIRTYVLPCAHSDCKGTLISEELNKKGNYVCVICDGITCVKCKMELYEDEHECDPDILKTVTLMERSSKPCPRCNARIHKISGCNQMFCTLCKCVFDWATLKIETGFMHNPHYLEWKRHNRDAGIEEHEPIADCEQLTTELGLLLQSSIDDLVKNNHISSEVPIHVMSKYSRVPYEEHLRLGWYICELVRMAIHYREVSIPQMEHIGYTTQTNRDVRLKFLANEISKEKFKSMIQRRDKKLSSELEINQIIQTFVEGLTDIVMTYMRIPFKTNEALFRMITSIIEFESYVNTCLYEVYTIYNYQIRMIVNF